jgi:hypothetical protein
VGLIFGFTWVRGGGGYTHLFGLLVVERVKRGGRLHAVGCNVFLHYYEQGLNIYIYKKYQGITSTTVFCVITDPEFLNI